MTGKRKRGEDDFEFSPPSSKLSKTQKEEVTRSGRARKKPARFLDDSIENVDNIDDESPEDEEEEEEESSPPPPIKTIIRTSPVKSPTAQPKLLQTLQAGPKPITVMMPQAQGIQQPVQIQVPVSSLLQSAPQITKVISPTQLKIINPVAKQVTQNVLPATIIQTPSAADNVEIAKHGKGINVQSPPALTNIKQGAGSVQTPTTTTETSEAGKRGRVRKKSAKVLEMEEFEEAEKTKPKKVAGKQQSPSVTSPVQHSPTGQLPIGITIIRNEQGHNAVLSMPGEIPGIVKVEPTSTKKSKGKGKVKELVNEGVESSQNLLVKEEPGDLSSVAALSPKLMTQSQGPQTATKKGKQIKSEPVTPKNQESPPSPSKKGKSVIKMLLNTPTQFTNPTVSTTAISSDKTKDVEKAVSVTESVKSEPSASVVTERPIKKILMSPSDLDDGHLSFDDDEDDDDFDDDMDDDDEGDDEDEMDWQFESQDGTLLAQDELGRKGKEISPSDGKKGKKKVSKKKAAHEDDEFDEEDFGDDDDDDDEGNLVIADDLNKKKKTTKKTSSKKKGDSKLSKAEKPAKEKKKKRLTAYTMWCNSMRNKVLLESPGIDFAQLSKRLGEIWQGLPSRDKMSWKRKAKKEARKLLGKGLLISTGKAATATQATQKAIQQKITTPAPKSVPPIHHLPISASQHRAAAAAVKQEDHAIQLRGSGIEPIDVAAYLKLVGESLSIIGMRLQEHRGLIAVQGSFSVLLDSLLCALGPLMCLTTQIPELHGCPAETHNRTLDNLAYFMPGL